MTARYRLTRKRRGTRYTQKMIECAVLRFFEVIGGYLPCHIHRYPAFKPEHHFLKGTVNIMYIVKVQPFFEHERHAVHPLFREIGVLRHFGHGHIAVKCNIIL